MGLAYCTGFEHQVPRANWSTYSSTNSGMFPNITIGAGGTCDYETTTVRNGDRAWKFARASADVGMWRQNPTVAHYILSFYLYIPAGGLPDAGSVSLVSSVNSMVANSGPGIKLDSNGYLHHRAHTSGAWQQSTTQLGAGAGWYLIEWYLNASANPHVSKLRINGVNQTDATYATAASSNGMLRFGLLQIDAGADNCEVIVDDVALFNAAADWSPGHGKVVVKRTSGVGTHADITKLYWTNDNGGSYTQVAATNTDVEQYIDEVGYTTGGSADGISQRANGSSGTYLEFAVEDITGETYDLKGFWCILHGVGEPGPGTTAGSTNLILRSNATNANIVNWSAVNGSDRMYGGVSATDPNGGGAWTNTAFNSIVIRWGTFSFAGGASWTYPRSDILVLEAYIPTDAPTFTISGNCGRAGATVTCTGDLSTSTTADGSGNYSIQNVPLLGDVTITPSYSGWLFSPTSLSFTDVISSQANQNFTAYSAFGPETMGGRR